MPRKRFTMAPDAARRRIECGHYDLNGGAPRCAALTHPWCLAPGEAPESCRFRIPKTTEPEPAPKTEPEPAPKTEPEPAPKTPKEKRTAAKSPEDAADGKTD